MADENDLGLLTKKFSQVSLSSLHVVQEPKKDLVSLKEFEKAQYSEMISKLNEIAYKVFKKGAMDAGYTFASLHYTFMEKEGAEREIGISILNKLLTTYFQTFNSPYLYSIFIHAYIIRWFRLIVMLDTKSYELLEFMHLDENWRVKNLRIFTFIDHPFKIFSTINPDNPVIPFISIDDQLMLDELIKSNKHESDEIGSEFAKYYHLILTRILKEQENLKYSFELQTMLGPKLVIELNKKEIASVIEGIAGYYFNLNTNFKKILADFDHDLNFQKIRFMRKKWIGEMKFGGVSFSKVVKDFKKTK